MDMHICTKTYTLQNIFAHNDKLNTYSFYLEVSEQCESHQVVATQVNDMIVIYLK